MALEYYFLQCETKDVHILGSEFHFQMKNFQQISNKSCPFFQISTKIIKKGEHKQIRSQKVIINSVSTDENYKYLTKIMAILENVTFKEM